MKYLSRLLGAAIRIFFPAIAGLSGCLVGAAPATKRPPNIILNSWLLAILLLLVPTAAGAAPLVLVEQGEPRAEIVVAPQRPRMTTLAALELQHYLSRMSGATIPIVTEATGRQPVRIHIGASTATQALGVTAAGLEHGAFRITTGPGWLAMVGDDFDAVPPEPSPKTRSQIEEKRAAWERQTAGATDAAWGFPFRSTFKSLWNPQDFDAIFGSRYGPQGLAFWKASSPLAGFWEQDRAGTLRAVGALLERLGLRWFMPGELGEVVPAAATIAVDPLREESVPAYAFRHWNHYGFGSFSFDDVMYARRHGIHSRGDFSEGPHGMVPVLMHARMKERHPEYYAVIDGQPDIEHRGYGRPNFLAPGLVEETARYIRYLFDNYGFRLVDIWPVDGLQVSQDEASRGQTVSNLVWGFVDRVAREVYRTHPAGLISCGAYASYQSPPSNVEKFPPNVVVQLSNCMRPLLEDEQRWQGFQKLVADWTAKVAPGNLLRLENNRHLLNNRLGNVVSFPVLHPRSIARELAFMKGKSLGDTGEQSQEKNRWFLPGLNHLNLYVQAKYLWNPDQPLEPLLNDYYEKFFGPAAREARRALEFAQDNLAWNDRSRSGGRSNPGNVPFETSQQFRALLTAARAAAGDTVFGRRLDLMLSELESENELLARKAKAEAEAAGLKELPILAVVEGAAWSKAEAQLLGTGGKIRSKTPRTAVRAGWESNYLLLEIDCPGDLPATTGGGPATERERVEVTLVTPRHSYYRIIVGRDGTVAEENPGARWKSVAEIRTVPRPGGWKAVLRIPAVGLEEGNSDPNHRVSGDRPTADAPWQINVTRLMKNPRGAGQLFQSLAPLMTKPADGPGPLVHLQIAARAGGPR